MEPSLTSPQVLVITCRWEDRMLVHGLCTAQRTLLVGIHQVGVDTRRNIKQHIGIMLRLDFREPCVVGAPEGLLPISRIPRRLLLSQILVDAL